MTETHSLSELMNAMVSRLEYAHPEVTHNIPEETQWKMIGLYISVDPVLAVLYKQYCEAKDGLGKLLIENGPEDPMTEIAWGMHDSLRAAVEDRLAHLKDDDAVSAKIQAIKNNQFVSRMVKSPRKMANQSLSDMMAFMAWANMAAKSPAMYDVRRDFSRAS